MEIEIALDEVADADLIALLASLSEEERREYIISALQTAVDGATRRGMTLTKFLNR